MLHRRRGRTHLLSPDIARVSHPEARICHRPEYACLPRESGKISCGTMTVAAIPPARQTMLDQCFSDIASIHGNARQLATVAVKFATDQLDPMTRHLGCQFVLRLQRCDAFRGARSINLRRIDGLDTELLTPAASVVDGEGIAIPDRASTNAKFPRPGWTG